MRCAALCVQGEIMSKDTPGRMIRKSISDSKKFAALSPKAAVLFAMLIPHYNSHGKMIGGAGYIKEVVCPRVEYLDTKSIPGLLQEISDKTNVKWFEFDGRMWLHSLKFLENHQELRKDRMGKDLLPDYSGTTPRVLPHEVKVKVKIKDKGEEPEKHDIYKEVLDKYWITYPHRNGMKTGSKPATESNIRKYVKPEEVDVFLKATLNFKESPDSKSGIGIPDPERFVYSAKKKCEPWRSYVKIETTYPEHKDTIQRDNPQLKMIRGPREDG
jgi:hypothetical protein